MNSKQNRNNNKNIRLRVSKKTNNHIKYVDGIISAPISSINNNGLYTASFFSGIRGLDIGAKKAGFTSLFQSDFWNVAGKAFEFNLSKENDPTHPKHFHSEGVFASGSENGNINNINFGMIQDLIGEHLNIRIKEGQLDVIHGGPPCQDFSKCNNNLKRRSLKRGLIFQLLRIVNEAQPKVVIIEQVPDMLCKKFSKTWNKVQLWLNSMVNYHWDFKVMNAKDFGARQNRKRLIIIMVRKDLGVFPSFPPETPVDLCKVSVNALLPHVYHYSPGQYKDDIKDAAKNVFCTMTATGSEYLYGFDGIRRNPTIDERLTLSELEGYKLGNIPFTHCKTLIGNMVQVSFAEALFRHVRTQILKK